MPVRGVLAVGFVLALVAVVLTPDLGSRALAVTPTGAAPDIFFAEDFETCGTVQFTGAFNMRVQAAEKAGGSCAARANGAAFDPIQKHAQMRKAFDASSGEHPGGVTDLYVRSWVKLIAAPGQTTELLTIDVSIDWVSLTVSSGAEGTRLGIFNRYNPQTSLTSATTLPVGEWHELQVHVRSTGPNSTVEAWMDDQVIDSLSTVQPLRVDTIGQFKIGGNSPAPVQDTAYDDVKASISRIPSSVPAATATPTATATPSLTPTATNTRVPTTTATATATATCNPAECPPPPSTNTPTATGTAEGCTPDTCPPPPTTGTPTGTQTAPATATLTSTVAPTSTSTSTATETATSTATATATATNPPPPTVTATATAAPTCNPVDCPPTPCDPITCPPPPATECPIDVCPPTPTECPITDCPPPPTTATATATGTGCPPEDCPPPPTTSTTTPTGTMTATASATRTSTVAPSSTSTPTQIPTASTTPTATSTATATCDRVLCPPPPTTSTPAATGTAEGCPPEFCPPPPDTDTPTPTGTAAGCPPEICPVPSTSTPTGTPTTTPTATQTSTAAPTSTSTSTSTSSPTQTPTATATAIATNTVTATATATNTPTPTATATATRTPGAACTASPSSARYNAEISVTCTGFGPRERVRLYWDSISSGSLSSFVVGRTGAGRGELDVPETPGGPHTVLARGASSSRRAATTVTVRPRASLSPSAGASGQRVKATFRSLKPGELVTIRWYVTATTTRTVARNLRASSLGTVVHTFTVPRATLGRHQVEGLGSLGSRAAATFTVNGVRPAEVEQQTLPTAVAPPTAVPTPPGAAPPTATPIPTATATAPPEPEPSATAVPAPESPPMPTPVPEPPTPVSLPTSLPTEAASASES